MGIVLAERRQRNKATRGKRKKAPTAKQLAARRRFTQVMKNGGFNRRRRPAGKKRNPRKTTQPKGSTWTPEYRTKVKRAAAQVRREMHAEGKLGRKPRTKQTPVRRTTGRTGGIMSRLFSRFANPPALQQHQALMKEWIKYEKQWRAGKLDAKGRTKQMQLERRIRQLEATIARQNPGRKVNAPGFGPRFKRPLVIIKKARRVVVKNISKRRRVMVKKKHNPKPAYNMFRGRQARQSYQVATSDRTPAAGVKEAGKLVELRLRGGKLIKGQGRSAVLYKGNKLYLGGLKFARPNPPGEIDLGEILTIAYKADKPHIEGDGASRVYEHRFGEEGGRKPHLVVGADGMPFLEGGSYRVTADGIVN